jgi:hypothetical protein
MRKTALPLVLIAAAAASDTLPPEPRAPTFQMEYRATVKDTPADAKRLDLWVPLPRDDPYQQSTGLRIDAGQSFQITASLDGNRMVHLAIASPHENVLTLKTGFNATREEHGQSRLSGGPPPARKEDPADLAKYLRPDRLVPLDDQIRAWARDVVNKAGAHTDLEMARASAIALISMPSSSDMRGPSAFPLASPSVFRCRPTAAKGRLPAIAAGRRVRL